jgi:DNA-binding IclR family transcriptional regulator
MVAVLYRDMRTLKTVERTLDVLEALEELNQARVSELADHLDLSKGGVYNHLATLHERGYVIKNEKQYRLSHRFFNLGHFVKHRTDLYNVAKQELDQLAGLTSGHAVLIIEEFGRAVYLYRAKGANGVSEEYSARRRESTDHLHISAAGKAILAYLPIEEVEEIVRCQGLPAKTPKTITDEDTLLEDLVTIRERNYSVCDEEAVPGIRAVGAPVINADGEVLGGISVSGARNQFSPEAVRGRFAQMVMNTADVIEADLATRNTPRGIR